MLSITLNGQSRDVQPDTSLSGLLAELGIDAREVAIEHNLKVIPKDQYPAILISAEDRIEIVRFVGGG